ncbi:MULTISPECIES: DUF1993 family protein [Sphingobium]|nr:DUF1993 family protein [Sphingobium indicum]
MKCYASQRVSHFKSKPPHAATAYDILRASGVPLGKRDYLGAVRKLP